MSANLPELARTLLPGQPFTAVLHACAHADCSRGRTLWHRLRRQRTGISLGGKWYCSAECFERAVLEFTVQAGRAVPPQCTVQHRIPLGLLLMSQGVISRQELRCAIEEQRKSGEGRLGDWLQRLHYAREEQVMAALGQQWACPVFQWKPTATAGCRSIIPFSLQQSLRTVPVYFNPFTRTLYVGFSDAVHYGVLRSLEQMLDCRTEPCIVATSALNVYLKGLDKELRPQEAAFALPLQCHEIASITKGYVLKAGARAVRATLCGPYLWFQLEGDPAMDLLFRLRHSDQVAGSWRSQSITEKAFSD